MFDSSQQIRSTVVPRAESSELAENTPGIRRTRNDMRLGSELQGFLAPVPVILWSYHVEVI
jgi:hypothetical protein